MVFIPTYLYIKQHSITGKLYFGKTIKNPEKYQGSGKHWKSHIKLHGKEHVETLWYCLFIDKESIRDFALNFSTIQNITESEHWLNLKDENGLDGGGNYSNDSKLKMSLSQLGKRGRINSVETLILMSKSAIGRTNSPEHCANTSKGLTGRTLTDSHIANMSKSRTGTVVVRNIITNEIYRVSTEEFLTNTDLVGRAKGTTKSAKTIENMRIAALNRKTKS